ncbi:hypothetical protein CAEBREN_31672 [Caenorhabditis brenneri]|uniref:C-type lectin domain-containing protein n=1 Tax=Caenorhabditis brenneri TaxID=135651 RepID=G0NTT6_CAEBE|nr:hypothetical protein CAEBREN_31672 [Caenorhabditis brenneri]
MRLLLLLLYSTTINTIFGQLEEDWGLRKACEKTGGKYTKRASRQSSTGDTCEMPFKVATRDEQDSRDFCELYAPWRLLKTERKKDAGRHTTICHVEATLMCEENWWQMFGHCFRMPDKHMVFTRGEAENLCKTSAPTGTEGTIAFMHHKYIVGVWRRYFRGTPQIWVSATESWNEYIQKTKTVDGDALALAFTGKHYDFSVTANSLIRIDASIRLNTLCQYKPPITPAEINYLGRRYSQIYYPSIPVDNGIMVRSASSYTRTAKNWDVCKKVLAPFMIEKIGDFVPEDYVLERMSRVNLGLTYLTRSGAIRELDGNGEHQQKNDATCHAYLPEYKIKVQEDRRADFPIKNITIDQNQDCDNMLSAAINHKDKAKLQIMSDSRSLPIWCKLGRPERFQHKPPPPGFIPFLRSDGKYMAHKLHKELKKYDEAKTICEAEGARLTGIDARKEAEHLIKIAQNEGINHKQMWVGGRRKKECMDQERWNDNKDHICYRSRVIYWEHAMAREFEESWWKDGPTEGTKNPDYASGGQDCLTLVVGTPGWADPKSGGFLDDISCRDVHAFFCSIPLEMTKVLVED